MAKIPRPPSLPDFRRPPITEVVLSIQFRALVAFGNAHVGLLWSKFDQKYPHVNEQPPLQAAFETFGSPRPTAPGIQIETILVPPMSRFWFVEASGHELVQVQQDRFLHNWRKREDEQRYPRYEAIRQRFEREVETFETFLREKQLGELKPNQCEVSYINVIEPPEGMDPHQALQQITPLWNGELSESSPLEFESNSVQCRFIMRENDRPIGRVHVSFVPAYRATNQKPVIRLEITARAKPFDESVESAFRLLDRQRREVVSTFAATTTPAMHQIWERTDAR